MAKKQPSTIDLLPPDIKEQLQELLRDPRVTQLAATAKINEILAQEGHQERVTKSSVNRYAVRMEEIGSKLRQSREIADMWVGKLGSQPAGQVGHLLNEMVRTLAFDAAMQLSEGDAPVAPKMLKDLSIAIERLEKASSENVKRAADIEKRALSDAAKRVESAAVQQGMNADQAAFWRQQVLGVQ
jgi:hypothetical protein